MKICSKIRILFWLGFIIAIPLHLWAQKTNAQYQTMEGPSEIFADFKNNPFNILQHTTCKMKGLRMLHFPEFKHFSDQTELKLKDNPLSFKKIQMSSDVLDSVIYTKEEERYKKLFTYNSQAKILTNVSQCWYTPAANWANVNRRVYTYAANSNLLSITYEDWDKNYGIWEENRRSVYTYDDKGNKLTYLSEYWNSGAKEWEHHYLYTYTYGSFGNILTTLMQEWYDEKKIWLNVFRSTITYDGKGNELSNVSARWDGSAQAWINNMRVTYTYDSKGHRLTDVNEHWDDDAGVWAKDDRFSNTYDSMGNLISDAYEQWNSNGGVWMPFWGDTYTYDGSGNLLTTLYREWDFKTSLWIPKSRYTLTYDDNGNKITRLSQSWDSDVGQWVNYKRVTFTYNSVGSVLTGLYESWDKMALKWKASERTAFSYDLNNNLTHFNHESRSFSAWNPSDGDCFLENNGDKYYYSCEELSAYYTPLTSIDNSNNQTLHTFSLAQNYPNPFNPSTIISWELPVRSAGGVVGCKVELTVYNIEGQKIRTLVNRHQPAGKYKVVFNGNGLASGIYFYKLQVGDKVQTRKMILVR